MIRHPISIGAKVFRSKSEALAFYKEILSSYEIGTQVCPEDFDLLFDLKYADKIRNEIELYEKEYDVEYDGERVDVEDLAREIRKNIREYLYESGNPLVSISVDRHPEFRNTRCFSFLYKDDELNYFSYTLAINGSISDQKRFSRACRHVVSDQLHKYKEQLFSNKPVRCSITNDVLDWENCQIDHKVPLTFSVIVKSFVIANKIDVGAIEYVSEITVEKFSDKTLLEKFREFHKEMAVLRAISTKQNKKLSNRARIKPTKKDYIIT